MRRLLSILLLMLTGLPLASPLLGMSGGADAGLPACCRRHGAHHCSMNVQAMRAAGQKQESGVPQWRAGMQCCRMYGSVGTLFHPDTMRPGTAAMLFAGLLSHPAVAPQTESRYRIARSRARQKRGPPSILTS